jgi:hypothetical protein
MSAKGPDESYVRIQYSRLERWFHFHPWFGLWAVRILEYFALFLVAVIISGILLALNLNWVPTNENNAFYFLSSMVQAQAAIVALVVSLTLIVIQMAAAFYTPRIVIIMRKNPDMWILLYIYLWAISYGFIVLKSVPPVDQDPHLVTWDLIIGLYTFSILFIYLINTIDLLRPDKIVTMLVDEITPENIHEEKWEDDIMQPVFDVVHVSISRYDSTTARTGLRALSERLWEIISLYDESSRYQKAAHIAEYFCAHIDRSALVALKNNDVGILQEIIAVLAKFGTKTAEKGWDIATWKVVEALETIGTKTAEKEWDMTTWRLVEHLKYIGIDAAEKRLELTTWGVVEALETIGTKTAEKEWEFPTLKVVEALETIGTKTAEKAWQIPTLRVVGALKKIFTRAAEKGLDGITAGVAGALEKIDTKAVEKGLDGITAGVVVTIVQEPATVQNEDK